MNKRPGRDGGGGGGPVAAPRVHDGRRRRLHARRHRVVHLLLRGSLVAGANLRYGQRARSEKICCLTGLTLQFGRRCRNIDSPFTQYNFGHIVLQGILRGHSDSRL